MLNLCALQVLIVAEYCYALSTFIVAVDISMLRALRSDFAFIVLLACDIQQWFGLLYRGFCLQAPISAKHQFLCPAVISAIIISAK